jgi:hypothetical protein
MDPKTTRLLIWIAIIAVLFLVFGKRLSGIISGAGSALTGGGGSGGGSMFDTTPGTITAPGVSPTPTAATSAQAGADGNPVGSTVVGGVMVSPIGGRGGYLGAAGSKASDVQPTFAYDQSGNSTFSMTVPDSSGVALPGITQGPKMMDLKAFGDFHANDARVVSQIAAEKSTVAPGQKGTVTGYRQDGTPIIIYFK